MTRNVDDEPGEFASSPCYQHELDGTPSEPLSTERLAARLNELLEGERAGARGLIEMRSGHDDELGRLLGAVAQDEARFCAMLGRHLARLGYPPSRETGVFYHKLAQRQTLADKLRLLDRGQAAVVRALDGLLEAIDDPELRADLEEMRECHVRNLEACAVYRGS